jgi:DNA-directed RNA polymerase
MMDTNVLPNDTQGFHTELQLSLDKLQKREDRAVSSAGFGSTIGGMTITSNYIGKVTEAVRADLKERPRTNSYAFRLQRFMRKLEPEVIALALLQAGLQFCGVEGKSTHRDVVLRIARALNDELWAVNLLKTNRTLGTQIQKKVKERYSSSDVRMKAAKKLAAKGDADGNSFVMQEWNNYEMSHAGNWGMTILQTAMPDVFELTEAAVFKGERMWRVTDHGLDLAKAAVREAVLKSPVYQPRAEPPKPWDTFIMRVSEDDRTLDRAQLIRTYHKDVMSAAKHGLRSGDMAPAVKGLNALQAVPFTINTWILDLIIDCYNQDLKVKGVPFRKKLEVPSRLSDAEFKAKSVEERRLLAKTIRGLSKANRTNDADTVQFVEAIDTAQRTATVERFFTPMNWDWRTRTYALTRFNYQREDYVRSLFLFAEGKPIGEEGLKWLKIHVANCGDFGKVSKRPFEEREQWADANLTDLVGYVEAPLVNQGWIQADKPFLFLAAARELVTALSVGTHYVTHLPTGWDGSCNGVQHMCLMTRDPQGRLVNLTDNKEPFDVYQVVADLAKELIQADEGNMTLFGKPDDDKPDRKTFAPRDELARKALDFGVDRKLCKRNVMTFSYASNEFGMSQQHFEDTMLPLELKVLKKELAAHPFGDNVDEWKLVSRYLAQQVRAAIQQVLSLPAQAMAFMQALAKTLAHEGKPLRWTTPAGVTCINRYHESTTQRVELYAYDKGVKIRTQITIATGYEAPIAKEKAAAGIAANLTHSLDASHLLLSVGNAVDADITAIATVHDSFGCLSCDAPRFIEIIRETLLRMYQDHDVLTELHESAKADLTPAGQERLQNELQKLGFDGPPEKGDLDITEIRRAQYAFA